ncbi:MAG: hypothetical protein GXX91_04410 [Verrucomicrobiaceae bacterium]|nr:hypothetical protein [Verrucomicrobiaceae bacterium]
MRIPGLRVLSPVKIRPCSAMIALFLGGGTLGAVDFQKDILPLVREHCWKCHSNEEEAKGGLAFDDIEALRKSQIGEHALIRPGDPAKSDFLTRLRLDSEEDDFMPKNGEALRRSELALIEQWIREGALIDSENPSAEELARADEVKIISAKAGDEVYFSWSNLEGKTIEARYVGMEGESVTIMVKNGRRFLVPLASLDPASVALAKKLSE